MTKKRSQSVGSDARPAVVGGRVSIRGRPSADDLPHDELIELAMWLSSDTVVVRLAMVSQGLELSLGAVDNEDQRRMTVDVARGQFVLETHLADLERLVLLIVQEQARAQGVVIKSVALRLKGVRPRQLDLFVTVSAKQGILAATLEMKGRVTIDDAFQARLSGFDVRGQGMLGGVVAMWLRPQLKQIEQEAYHISSVVPGNLQIQDVRLEVDQQLRIIATLAGSSLFLEKPTGGTMTPEPRVANAKSSASQRPALAAPKKLDIYVIDTGWNEKAKSILDGHLTLFEAFLSEQNIYVLSTAQSKQVLKQNPALIGADPILMVVDSDRRVERPDKGYGFRFCLGAMPQEEACAEALKRMLRIVAEGARVSTDNIMERITAEMHREGLDGAMQIVVDVVEATAER